MHFLFPFINCPIIRSLLIYFSLIRVMHFSYDVFAVIHSFIGIFFFIFYLKWKTLENKNYKVDFEMKMLPLLRGDWKIRNNRKS